jgi:pSer/pThr/pTyr-binding forkhead associated (FHA) protein
MQYIYSNMRHIAAIDSFQASSRQVSERHCCLHRVQELGDYPAAQFAEKSVSVEIRDHSSTPAWCKTVNLLRSGTSLARVRLHSLTNNGPRIAKQRYVMIVAKRFRILHGTSSKIIHQGDDETHPGLSEH